MKPKHRRQTADRNDRARGRVSRRSFVRGVVVASMATGLPRLDALAASPDLPSLAGAAQSRDELLRAVLNRVIPASGVMPAAGDVGVGAFVEEAAQTSGRVRRQVDRVLAACRRETGALRSDGAIDRALRRLERERPVEFDLFIQAVYAGYYTHPRVLAALHRA